MKVYNSNEEVKKDIVDGVLDLKGQDVEFDFSSLNIDADINAGNIDAGNIDAWDINAGNINAWNIDARNIKAGNINAGNIKAWDINAWDINAWDINAGNINAGNINAWNIDAGNISYYAFCLTSSSLECIKIEGRRDNSLHKCLDQEIEFKELDKEKGYIRFKEDCHLRDNCEIMSSGNTSNTTPTFTSSSLDREAYEKDLKERQDKHLDSIHNGSDLNWRPCLHDSCPECIGTGRKGDGSTCVHNISCPCPKCTPTC